MDNDAVKKVSTEAAAAFSKWLEAPETKAALEATRSAGDDSGSFEVVITTENVDRYGEVIKLDGWELENYMNNPVVLLSHDSSQPPIGIATGVVSRDGKMIATGKFAPASANPVAQQIRQLYDLGIMRATSVGFIEKEREGNLITKAELLEFSFVSIPANPFALSTMVKSGISIDGLVTKGLIQFRETEHEEPAGAEPEPVSAEEPQVPVEEGEAGEEAMSKAVKPLIAQLKDLVVALEAAAETGAPERDEQSEADDEEARRYREFSQNRKTLQDAATVIGEVLAEARRAVEHA
jgi:hypothetical protein